MKTNKQTVFKSVDEMLRATGQSKTANAVKKLNEKSKISYQILDARCRSKYAINVSGLARKMGMLEDEYFNWELQFDNQFATTDLIKFARALDLDLIISFCHLPTTKVAGL